MSSNYQYLGILKYPSAQLTAVYGLTDMLTTANDFILQQGNKNTPLFCITHWELDSKNQTFEPAFSTLNNPAFQQNIIVVPGSFDMRRLNDISHIASKWVTEQYAGGAITSSVCVGAFILAKTGILDNRHATTHWASEEEFEEQYPNIKVDTDQIIVDEGDIITAAGVMAWLDLGLRLIHQFSGA